ncbi:MAG: hypothetical protein JWM80_3629 [Cyanobacteria bacterium RYN_339]|nr:hypothetical protein [Cyanobacteria bacterium RYN_339]
MRAPRVHKTPTMTTPVTTSKKPQDRAQCVAKGVEAAKPGPKLDLKDKFQASAAPCPEPDLTAPPKGMPGWLHHVWDLMFGNTENKLFQIKMNLIHFKDVLLNLVTVLETGPLQPLFTLIEKVGGLISGGFSRFKGLSAEGGAIGKVAGFLGKCAKPAQRVLGASFRFLERTAPIFGWLTTVQDGYKAIIFQGDKRSSGQRKFYGWATFALSAIGATASTIGAWAATGAAVTLPTGFGAVTLGTVAIVAFGLSLLTGWLGSRAAKLQKA